MIINMGEKDFLINELEKGKTNFNLILNTKINVQS